MFPNFGSEFAAQMAKEAVTHVSGAGRLSKQGVDNMVSIILTTEPDLKPVPFEQIGTDRYLP